MHLWVRRKVHQKHTLGRGDEGALEGIGLAHQLLQVGAHLFHLVFLEERLHPGPAGIGLAKGQVSVQFIGNCLDTGCGGGKSKNWGMTLRYPTPRHEAA